MALVAVQSVGGHGIAAALIIESDGHICEIPRCRSMMESEAMCRFNASCLLAEASRNQIVHLPVVRVGRFPAIRSSPNTAGVWLKTEQRAADVE
jgi:hypothetical protein